MLILQIAAGILLAGFIIGLLYILAHESPLTRDTFAIGAWLAVLILLAIIFLIWETWPHAEASL